MRNLVLTVLPLLGCATAPVRATEPEPRPAPGDDVVFHEVQFDVAAPRAAFVRAFLAAPLERFIKGTDALPGVVRTEPLTEAHYPTVGSVRLVVRCVPMMVRPVPQ
jgi:hypothetical protein